MILGLYTSLAVAGTLQAGVAKVNGTLPIGVPLAGFNHGGRYVDSTLQPQHFTSYTNSSTPHNPHLYHITNIYIIGEQLDGLSQIQKNIPHGWLPMWVSWILLGYSMCLYTTSLVLSYSSPIIILLGQSACTRRWCDPNMLCYN